MDNIKLNLIVLLPGSTRMSEQLCSENSNYDTEKITVPNRKKQEVISIKLRKTIPAKQVINMGKEAYDYFVGKEAPYSIRPKQWAKLSKKERLKIHLDEICKALNGISYTYKVFDE